MPKLINTVMRLHYSDSAELPHLFSVGDDSLVLQSVGLVDFEPALEWVRGQLSAQLLLRVVASDGEGRAFHAVSLREALAYLERWKSTLAMWGGAGGADALSTLQTLSGNVPFNCAILVPPRCAVDARLSIEAPMRVPITISGLRIRDIG